MNLRLTVNKPNDMIRLENTSTQEVNKIICSQKPRIPMDMTGYQQKYLKLSAPYIVSSLTYITNKMLSSGTFPDRLKYSEVIPIYKNGNTEDLSNYRAISLSFSKIMEKILHKRIYQFFYQLKLFVKEQHGFRQSASTETATFNLLNTILKSLDSKSTVGGLFLDICEAFDSVDRNILLSKLDFCYFGKEQ